MCFISSAIIWEFIKAVIGPFVGASLAFYYAQRKAAADKVSGYRASLVKSQLVLICHANSLENMRRHYAPFRDIPDRERHIQRCDHIFDSSSVDVASLSFLVEHDKGDVIMANYLADTAYRNACEAITDRNNQFTKLFGSSVTEEFDSDTGKGGFIFPAPELFLLKQLTDTLFNMIDKAIAENNACTEGNLKLAKEIFRGSRFPRTSAIPESKPETPTKG